MAESIEGDAAEGTKPTTPTEALSTHTGVFGLTIPMPNEVLYHDRFPVIDYAKRELARKLCAILWKCLSDGRSYVVRTSMPPIYTVTHEPGKSFINQGLFCLLQNWQEAKVGEYCHDLGPDTPSTSGYLREYRMPVYNPGSLDHEERTFRWERWDDGAGETFVIWKRVA